jgi:hypothetical protein
MPRNGKAAKEAFHSVSDQKALHIHVAISGLAVDFECLSGLIRNRQEMASAYGLITDQTCSIVA